MRHMTSFQTWCGIGIAGLRIVAIVAIAGTALLKPTALAVAEEMTPKHHDRGSPISYEQPLDPQACQLLPDHRAVDSHASSATKPASLMQFEGVQIETADIKPYEVFFETVLHARPLLRIDHPQVDHIRSYCYRDILIVVRQDLRTPRPTGWVQINFAVPDVSSVKEELERALEHSPAAQSDAAVRIRLKPDVPRNNCRAIRLEVVGPEGFMVGFNQFKEGTCKPHEHKTEDGR